jgi:hypothetical protein
MPRLSHYLYFYVSHALFLFAACFAYLFHFRPEILDWSHWIAVFLVLLWGVYNSPLFAKVVGYTFLQSYRRLCLRCFTVFRAISLFVLIALLGIGGFMFNELLSRFRYVYMIKQMTLDKGTGELPFATASDLAAAFNLYPHRREVPFILARMGRLLSFDDHTSNYNQFVGAFWKGIDVTRITDKYKDKKRLERYEGAIDPIIYLARLKIEVNYESNARFNSFEDALTLLDKYRRGDMLAEIYRMVYEHELIGNNDGSKCGDYLQLKNKITSFLNKVIAQESPKGHIRLVTSHVFQELLDHYAQLHIDLAIAENEQGVKRKSIIECKDANKVTETVLTVPQLYIRILTIRKQIANVSDVLWLEGPGKFTIYQYFKHQVGRETGTTRYIMGLLDKLPGLQESMKKRIFDVEAFKEFRNLESWDNGTPLSASFSGIGMHKTLIEWLKSGW